MSKYNHKEIEKKWKKNWEKSGIYKTKEETGKPKYYVLDMFPYPSGAGLHVGHPKGYIATDIVGRMKMMQGFNVLHPMGWDAFGLPAENYAIKNKVHPSVATAENVATFKKQLGLLGFTYDWDREVNTTDPKYYKWTQWIFLQLFKKGLAFESCEPINWCPNCQTGLANEDLDGGKCERCGSEIEKKPMRQWVLRITDYAEKLLNGLEQLPLWPDHIKKMQSDWIGKSEGMLFTAPVKDTDLTLQTFSAHFEAFRADTFVVIAPDHPFLKELIKDTPTEKEVLGFSNDLVKQRAQAGFEQKESQGIFTGRYIIDPVGNGDLPIWVASYALADYGTGIVKCSAHDERDFLFAKKYNIKLKEVLERTPENSDLEKCNTDMKNSILLEPAELKGKVSGKVREEVIQYLEKNNLATRKISYRLRDWVFSRQRYWGEPIPLVNCQKDGWVPVPEDQLPLELPKVKNYEPSGTGESPLATIADWVNTTCPQCGGQAKRETNTMPQWAGSCWYYLAYTMPKNEQGNYDWDKNKINYWNPIDLYVGGAEHATRHLIYARFWHKFLFDIGAVENEEPFTRLQNVGLILAEDGRKMSKRWNNVINPNEVVEEYGADAMRLYEMFMGPFDQPCAWSTKGVVGVRRFLERVWNLNEKVGDTQNNKKITAQIHQTIKKVSGDIEAMRFNTAISTMMELINEFSKCENINKEDYLVLLKLLSPFAPHLTEELWSQLDSQGSIFESTWPQYDAEMAKDEEITLAVQINGKLRDTLVVSAEISEEEAKKLVLDGEKIQKWLDGKSPKKVIYVKGKLVSIVI